MYVSLIAAQFPTIQSAQLVQIRYKNYFISNKLGDNKLLNKKSEFANKCHDQKETVIK